MGSSQVLQGLWLEGFMGFARGLKRGFCSRSGMKEHWQNKAFIYVYKVFIF